MNNLDLFADQPPSAAAPAAAVPPMVRTPDARASIAAATKVRPHGTGLRDAILSEIRHRGPITALQLEEMSHFAQMAPSTVRKRVSELKEMRLIEEAGVVDYTTAAGRKTQATAWKAVGQ
jgi:hypothetical protein